MTLMIAGAKLTYEGIKAKHAETTEGFKSRFSFKRAAVLVVTPGDHWITWDELLTRVTEAWEEPRIAVAGELVHDLHFFSNEQLMYLARDAVNLGKIIHEVVERNHGGIKFNELIRSIISKPDVMTPINLEASLIATINGDAKLGLLNYGDQKRFVYKK